jgi:hypothetical protein
MKRYWMLFLHLFEMIKWILSLLLLMCCITFIDHLLR